MTSSQLEICSRCGFKRCENQPREAWRRFIFCLSLSAIHTMTADFSLFAGSPHRDLRQRRLRDRQELQPHHQSASLRGLPAGCPERHPAAAAVLPPGRSPRLRRKSGVRLFCQMRFMSPICHSSCKNTLVYQALIVQHYSNKKPFTITMFTRGKVEVKLRTIIQTFRSERCCSTL